MILTDNGKVLMSPNGKVYKGNSSGDTNLQALLDKKQDKLKAGNGISISSDGTISVTFADGDTEEY